MRQVWRGARVLDGGQLREGMALVAKDGIVAALVPDTGEGEDLGGGVLLPGFIDLQVNGGGGALLGQGDPDEALATICGTHGRLGTTGLLPTLITSDPETTAAVIAAGVRAAKAGLPGFLGLHLEGPHLDPRRKGAHDPSLIRPMEDADLAALLAAAEALPRLMVTVAPEAVSLAQVEALAKAGVVVSLGHTGCTEAEARAAIRAGASAVTHLYNAMSPLGHRAPGLVGAALESSVWIGIIPDGVHVAETAFRIASRLAGGRLFAVTDAMAVAGTDLESFTLGGRTILRQDGRLTLQDGTLAGADVTMPQALAWMNGLAHDRLADASRLTSGVAATVLRLGDRGWLGPGARADMVHLREDGALAAVWRGGARLA